MQGFSNQSIKAHVDSKPHICRRNGYWRVSPLQWKKGTTVANWTMAHSFTKRLNDDRWRK